MANPENLILNSERTPSERRELASKAGKASGEARRRRKTLREELLLMLEDPDIQQSITAALLRNAIDGDNKAYEIIRDTIGEKPKDVIDISSNEIRISIDD